MLAAPPDDGNHDQAFARPALYSCEEIIFFILIHLIDLLWFST